MVVPYHIKYDSMVLCYLQNRMPNLHIAPATTECFRVWTPTGSKARLTVVTQITGHHGLMCCFEVYCLFLNEPQIIGSVRSHGVLEVWGWKGFWEHGWEGRRERKGGEKGRGERRQEKGERRKREKERELRHWGRRHPLSTPSINKGLIHIKRLIT